MAETDSGPNPTTVQWFRSMLFVPGNLPERMKKAVRYGADALIFDLEDSVPDQEKDHARAAAAAAVAGLADSGTGLFVRVNSWRTGHLLKDVLAVVSAGLTGIVLPKTYGPADVHALDHLLSELEIDRGIRPGSIHIFPLAETAGALLDVHRLCSASPRVRESAAGSSRNGDLNLALGFRWTKEGEESLYIRSKLIAEARAAGVEQIFGGLVIDIADLDQVRYEAERSRQLGCTGMLVIHPTHVDIANEVFRPSDEEIDDARAVLDAVAAAVAAGQSAARLNGEMVDYANVRSAYTLIRKAEDFGLHVGPHANVPVQLFSDAHDGRGTRETRISLDRS